MKHIYVLFISAIIYVPASAQNNLKTGQTFRDCPDCPEMVVIPSGSFIMGSPENEMGRYPEESPQRKVSIKQFAAGKFDITKEQWAAFVKATNHPAGGNCGWAKLPGEDSTQPWLPDSAANWNHVGFAQDSSHPAICISWDDANDYVHWLSKKTGFTYRLLSEAEWEYASRAGTTTLYPWGSAASHDYANYGTDTVAGVGFASGRDKWDYGTSPVGSFPPNQFGLYDMQGNVLQWVDDCFSKSYLGLPTNGSANKEDILLDTAGTMTWMIIKTACAFHMIRGSAFGDTPRMLRSAFRNWGSVPGAMVPDLSRSAGAGFRVARTL